MTYREFCNELAPIVLELQNEVKEMSENGFKIYRAKVMEEIRVKGPKICEPFMSAIFDMIYKNVFKVT